MARLLLLLAVATARAQSLEQPENGQVSKTDGHPPILFAVGTISTGDDESHPTFTKDGDTLYFIKSTPTFDHWTIVFSTLGDGQWSVPRVAPFSGRYSDADVAFSPDGNRLFFISNRPLTAGAVPKKDTDLWMMEREGSGWGKPRPLSNINSSGFEWFPTVTRGGTLYFGSERETGNFGPKGSSDLWRSRYIGGRYEEPENLGAVINTPGNDIEGYIDPDERFLIFSSNGHKDSRGSYDLYISYNRNGRWSTPRNLGDGINTEAWDFGAKLSPDGGHLYFSSNRSLFSHPLDSPLDYGTLIKKLRSPGNGMRDIYRVEAGFVQNLDSTGLKK